MLRAEPENLLPEENQERAETEKNIQSRNRAKTGNIDENFVKPEGSSVANREEKVMSLVELK